MAVPGNAYPAVQLDADGKVVDSGVVVQFTDGSDQPTAATAATLVKTVTLASDGTLAVSGIPQGLGSLQIVALVRSAKAAQVDTLLGQINGDTTSGHYASGQIYASPGASAGVPASSFDAADSAARLGFISGGSAPAGQFTGVVITIPFYAGITTQKGIVTSPTFAEGTTAATDPFAGIGGCQWLSTAAVTAVALGGDDSGFSDLAAGSAMSVYLLSA